MRLSICDLQFTTFLKRKNRNLVQDMHFTLIQHLCNFYSFWFRGKSSGEENFETLQKQIKMVSTTKAPNICYSLPIELNSAEKSNLKQKIEMIALCKKFDALHILKFRRTY